MNCSSEKSERPLGSVPINPPCDQAPDSLHDASASKLGGTLSVQSMPLREMQRTSAPSQRHSRRTPSYLSSYTQPSSPGTLSTSVASCGWIDSLTFLFRRWVGRSLSAGSELPRVPDDF